MRKHITIEQFDSPSNTIKAFDNVTSYKTTQFGDDYFFQVNYGIDGKSEALVKVSNIQSVVIQEFED